MKSLLVVAAISAAAGFAASGVRADTKILATAGSWDAFGGTTENGVPVCGISSDSRNQYFGVKLFSGNQTFSIQLGGTGFEAEEKQRMKVIMVFDARSPWTAKGTGFRFSDGDPALQFTIKLEDLNTFKNEFRSASRLRVRFPDTRNADWVLSLSGTNAVYKQFDDCTRNLK